MTDEQKAAIRKLAVFISGPEVAPDIFEAGKIVVDLALKYLEAEK